MEEEQMEEGNATQTQPKQDDRQHHSSPSKFPLLLLLNCTLLLLGVGGPLLLRVYFLHGGKRMWLSSWLQQAGCPLLLLLHLSISSLRRRRREANKKLFSLTPPLAAAFGGIGLLSGLDGYLFTYSSSYLPVTTGSILMSAQLAFTALFAFLIVRQRFTAYSVNAVFLLTLGAVALGLKAGGDRPEGETKGQYYLGFVMTLGAAALYGLLVPLTEVAYRRSGKAITYSLVVQATVVMAFAGAGVCTVGMLVNKDFQAIPKEAKKFGLGETKYYMLLVWDAILWQFYNLGLVGLILYSSSLFAGIVVAVLIPVTEVMAVILLHEKFDGQKGLSLALCLWGFGSYLYGERRRKNKLRRSARGSGGSTVATVVAPSINQILAS